MELSYLEYVILFKIFIFFLEFYIDLRQYWRFKATERPSNILGLITEENFKKAQEYQKEKMEFHLFTTFNDFVTQLVVIYFFIVPYVWNKSGEILTKIGLDGNSEVYRTLFGFLIQTLIGIVEGIPKELYSKFVIDERHGFNKMTLKLLITDTVKSTILSILIGFPVISIIIKIM